jgi:hypothetical protein
VAAAAAGAVVAAGFGAAVGAAAAGAVVAAGAGAAVEHADASAVVASATIPSPRMTPWFLSRLSNAMPMSPSLEGVTAVC